MAEGQGASSFPSAPPSTPGFPSNPLPIIFEAFAGLNTKPLRPGIGDTEMYWCDGFMPLGVNNLRTLYDAGTSLFTSDAAKTIPFFQFGNIGSTAYCFVFQSDGKVYQVQVSNGTKTVVAAASTITTPANPIGFTQWGNEFIAFSSNQTNGFWLWDGTSLYTAGTLGPIITMLNSGSKYTGAPTIALTTTGSGTGATFSATVSNGSVTTINVTNPGSGFGVNDFTLLTLTGGGSDNTAKANATVTASSGGVQSAFVLDGGFGYSAATYAVAIGGGGTGCILTTTGSGGVITGVSVTNPGKGYTSAPTIQVIDPVGTKGTGASATASIAGGSVSSVTVNTGGYSYASGSVSVVFSGGGGTGAAGTATVSSNAVTAISVTSGGSGYTSPPAVSIIDTTGIGGSGAVVVAVISVGEVSGISIVSAGTGYLSPPSVVIIGDGTGAQGQAIINNSGGVTGVSITQGGSGYTKALVQFLGGNNAAAAEAFLMPFGVKGTTMEVAFGRIWVGNGNQAFFSAPGNPADFGVPDGGGEFQSNDSFLRIAYQSFKQSNGFLYLLADSSINYVSGVNTAGVPAITTFSNLNVDPQIGTPWPSSVQVFSRNIVFANNLGVHVSYGGAVTKVSEALDGIYNSVANQGNPSSAVANIFGIQVYMLLLPVIDTYTGDQVLKFLMWDGKKWWTSQQTPNITFIAAQEINSVLSAWGTDNTHIYPLFTTPSVTLRKVAQSKLWSMPSYLYTKTAPRIYGVVNSYVSTANRVGGITTINIDNETPTATTTSPLSVTSLLWTNSAGNPITWTNNSSNPISWVIGGLIVFGPVAIGQFGHLLGLTVVTTVPDLAIDSLLLLEEEWQANV